LGINPLNLKDKDTFTKSAKVFFDLDNLLSEVVWQKAFQSGWIVTINPCIE